MAKHANDRLGGTLDLLILNAVARSGAMHGYAIAQAIRGWSDEMLEIEDGSLYPALHRMTEEKWLKAEWGITETNRKARFYAITAAGRRQLESEERTWAQLIDAVGRVLRGAGAGG
ncbi:MAG: PadR family transcriptional regulator [Acidobacteriia bacterium]|nr:PadR family transcriptional regulator [Terriglobia bacterium]